MEQKTQYAALRKYNILEKENNIKAKLYQKLNLFLNSA